MAKKRKKQAKYPSISKTLRTYFAARAKLVEQVREGSYPESFTAAHQEIYRKAVAQFISARIFDIPRSFYAAVINEADQMLGDLVDENYVGEDDAMTTEDLDRCAKAIHTRLRSLETPPMPFGAVYLGYGVGIEDPDMELGDSDDPRSYINKLDFLVPPQFFLVGHLVCAEPFGVSAVHYGPGVLKDGSAGWALHITAVTDIDGKWILTTKEDPFLVTTILRAIHDKATTIVDHVRNPYYHKAARKLRGLKRECFTPPPYYTVTVKDTVIQRVIAAAKGEVIEGARQYGHRWDVRRHDRLYVKRGQLPMTLDMRGKLQLAGYRIWALEPLDAEAALDLQKRNMPRKKQGEWVAIKKVSIDAYVKGPDDKPYIPAVRELVL